MPAADRSRFRHGRRSRPPKNFGSMKKLIVLGLVALTAFSCVSTKKFNSMKAEALRLEGELTASKSRLEDMGALNDKLTAEKMQLIADTTRLSNDLKECKKRYKQLLADGSAESARMLRELEDKEMALNDRVRRVAELEGMLKSREEAIDAIRRKVTDALTGFEGKGRSRSATATYTSRWTTNCCSVRAVSKLTRTARAPSATWPKCWRRTPIST